MNDISSDHLLRTDRDSLEAILKQIEALIPLAEAHGRREAVHYLVLAQAETKRLLAVERDALRN